MSATQIELSNNEKRLVHIDVICICLQIVLCQNNIHQQSHMNRVVTHELIHAFDHCRAHVDWFNNFRHLACSEVSSCVFEEVLNIATSQYTLLNAVCARI